MNKGTYGFNLPPNYATRVAPPTWTNYRAYTTPGTYSFTVPQNVYQIGAMVFGPGGNGAGAYGYSAPFPYEMTLALSGSNGAMNNYFVPQIYYGTGTTLFLAKSSDATIAKTTNGFSSTTSVSTGVSSVARAIAGNGNNLVVCGTTTTPGIRISSDLGSTWSTPTGAPTFPDYPLLFNNGSTFIVLNQNTGRTSDYKSTDNGATWSAITTNFGAQIPNYAKYSNGVYIIAGSGGALVTSTDATTWTLNSSASTAMSAASINAIANNGGSTWVIVGASGKVAYSTNNGTTWTAATGTGSGTFQSITYDSTLGLFAAVGNDGSVYVSSNGISWTAYTHGLSTNACKITSGNGKFLICIDSAASYTNFSFSYNGTLWNKTQQNASTGQGWALISTGGSVGNPFYFNNSFFAPNNSGAPIAISSFANGGGGGGFSYGIIDVVPGQTLSTITVGAAASLGSGSLTGSTSSVGSLLTATSGSQDGTGGTGFASPALRGAYTASGGRGGMANPSDFFSSTNGNNFTPKACQAGGGGAAGTLFGDGGIGGEWTSTQAVANTTAPQAGGGAGIAGGNGAGFSGSASSYAGGGGAFGVSAGLSSGGAGTGGQGVQSTVPGAGGSGFTSGAGATGAAPPAPLGAILKPVFFKLFDGTFDGSGGAGSGNSGSNYSGSGTGAGGGSFNTTSSSYSAGNGSAGGGGGASYITGSTQFTAGLYIAGSGGLCGGGGSFAGTTSVAASNISQNAIQCGNGGLLGGGGGGSATVATSDGTNTTTAPASGAFSVKSGKGGNGGVILFWTEGF